MYFKFLNLADLMKKSVLGVLGCPESNKGLGNYNEGLSYLKCLGEHFAPNIFAPSQAVLELRPEMYLIRGTILAKMAVLHYK